MSALGLAFPFRDIGMHPEEMGTTRRHKKEWVESGLSGSFAIRLLRIGPLTDFGIEEQNMTGSSFRTGRVSEESSAGSHFTCPVLGVCGGIEVEGHDERSFNWNRPDFEGSSPESHFSCPAFGVSGGIEVKGYDERSLVRRKPHAK